MSPPIATATRSPRCTTTAVTPETLIRDTHALIEAAGIDRSANWVTKAVRAYLRSPLRNLPFGPVLAARLKLNAQQRTELYARTEYRYVLEYADPTGETAVRNVMAVQR